MLNFSGQAWTVSSVVSSTQDLLEMKKHWNFSEIAIYKTTISKKKKMFVRHFSKLVFQTIAEMQKNGKKCRQAAEQITRLNVKIKPQDVCFGQSQMV